MSSCCARNSSETRSNDVSARNGAGLGAVLSVSAGTFGFSAAKMERLARGSLFSSMGISGVEKGTLGAELKDSPAAKEMNNTSQ